MSNTGQVTIEPAAFEQNVSFRSTIEINPIPTPSRSTTGTTVYMDSSDNKMRLMDTIGKVDILTDSLTSKGDMIVSSGNKSTVLKVGSDGTALTADSSDVTGVSYQGLDINNTMVDPQMTRFYAACAMTTQNLAAQGPTYILFNTDNYVDRSTFSRVIGDPSVMLNTRGIYLVKASVTIYNNPASNLTTTQWTVEEDNDDNVYSTVPYSTSFTTNASSGTDYQCATILACVIVGETENNLTERRIRINGTIISGSSTLTIAPNYSQLEIFRLNNCHICQLVGTSDVPAQTTLTDMVWSSVPMIDTTYYKHTPGDAMVTILVDGIYFVNYKVTCSKTSGTDYTSVSAQMVKGSSRTYIQGTTSANPVLYTNANVTFTFQGMVQFAANDTFGIQTVVDVGSNVSIHATYCNVNVIRMDNVTYPSAAYFSAYTNTPPTPIQLSSTWVDVPLYNNSILTPSGSYTLNGNSTTVINNTNMGPYVVLASAHANNANKVTGRYLFTRLLWSLDNGSTWYVLLGTLRQVPINYQTTVQSSRFAQMPLGSMIKLQMSTNGTTADNIVIGRSTTVSILSPENVTDTIRSFMTFGTYYSYADSQDNYNLTETTYTEKLRLSTKTLPTGAYRVSVVGLISINAQGATANVKLTHVRPDHSNNVILQQSISFFKTGQTNMNQILIVQMPYGVNQLVLEAYTSGNTSIQGLLIELFRIF